MAPRSLWIVVFALRLRVLRAIQAHVIFVPHIV